MKNAKAIISILVVIIILGSLGYWIFKRLSPKTAPQASGPMPMPVAKCVFRDVTNYGQYSGNLASIESVEIRARVQGFLRNVAFEDGAFVKKVAKISYRIGMVGRAIVGGKNKYWVIL